MLPCVANAIAPVPRELVVQSSEPSCLQVRDEGGKYPGIRIENTCTSDATITGIEIASNESTGIATQVTARPIEIRTKKDGEFYLEDYIFVFNEGECESLAKKQKQEDELRWQEDVSFYKERESHCQKYPEGQPLAKWCIKPTQPPDSPILTKIACKKISLPKRAALSMGIGWEQSYTISGSLENSAAGTNSSNILLIGKMTNPGIESIK